MSTNSEEKIENHSHHSHGEHKKNDKKKTMKHWVSIGLSFVFALCLSSLIALISIEAGVFNYSVFMNQLNKTNYYRNISNAIRENAEDILRPTGLPSEILDDVIVDNRIYLDAKNCIEAQLSEKEYVLDTSDMKEQFKKNIYNYIEKSKLEVGKETESGIDKLFTDISNEYIRLLEFPFIKYLTKYKAQYEKVFWPAVIILAIVCAGLCFAIIKMHSWVHRGLRYISYGTLASAFITGIIPGVLVVTNIYKRLSISPKYLYALLVGVIQADLMVFVYMAVALAIIFAAMLMVINMLKKRVVKH